MKNLFVKLFLILCIFCFSDLCSMSLLRKLCCCCYNIGEEDDSDQAAEVALESLKNCNSNIVDQAMNDFAEWAKTDPQIKQSSKKLDVFFKKYRSRFKKK
jgi:hypothetical protein